MPTMASTCAHVLSPMCALVLQTLQSPVVRVTTCVTVVNLGPHRRRARVGAQNCPATGACAVGAGLYGLATILVAPLATLTQPQIGCRAITRLEHL